MVIIILLVFLGILFLVAELVLLSGSTVGTLLSLACYGIAAYMAFAKFGYVAGLTVVAVIAVLSLAATVISLRTKTWQRLSLKQEIEASSMEKPEQFLKIGDRGVTVGRLSPMGKADFGGRIFEAKSADAYIDPKSEVEVTGFENFNVLVRKINNI